MTKPVELRAPLVVAIELTDWCNLNCVHCFTSSSPSSATSGELDLNEWREVLKELRAMGVFIIDVGGGEPFARKDCLSIFQIIIDEGFDYSITTNGTLINRRVASALRSIGITGNLQVSLDGLATTHNKIRNSYNAFEKSSAGIRYLLEEKIKVSVGSVVMRSNIKDIPELITKFYKMGVMDFHLMGLMPVGRGKEVFEDEMPTPQDRNLMDKDLQRLREQYPNLRLYKAEPKSPVKFPSRCDVITKGHFEEIFRACQCGSARAIISSCGRVFPCDLLRTSPFCFGNVKKSPFAEIWKGSGFSSFRNIKRGYHGCRALAVACSGDIRGSDPTPLLLRKKHLIDGGKI